MHPAPILCEFLLPLEQTDAERTIGGCTLRVARSSKQIVAFGVFADGASCRKFRGEACHALADASQPFGGQGVVFTLVKLGNDFLALDEKVEKCAFYAAF
jgi:hypothetical protein